MGKMTATKSVKKARRQVGANTGAWKRTVRRTARRANRQAIQVGNFNADPIRLTSHDVS